MAYYFVKKKHRFTKGKRKIMGISTISLGVLILFYFFFPLLSLNIFFNSGADIQAPIPKYSIVSGEGIGSLIAQGISRLTLNYNDARSWYPQVRSATHASTPSYSLSIPTLKINNAQVSTIDYDLTRHLIQYAGTSIPGENGTAVIFGHSTLPQWFDQKNYKSIFATLHTIKKGDEILAKVNNITYTYKVFSISIAPPEDTNMFSQSYDHSYITIVTCTPPGTVWKRLVVRASLEEVGKKAVRVLPTRNTLLAGSFMY